MSRRNIDGRIFHMESTLLDSPTTSWLSNQSVDHPNNRRELRLRSNPRIKFPKCFWAAFDHRNVEIEILSPLPIDKIQNSKREMTNVGAKV
jgi:hypothetical protein